VNTFQHARLATVATLVTLGIAACAAPAAQPSSTPSASIPAAAALDDRPLDEQLVDAVVAGDIALAALAIEAGADASLVDDTTENTPLSIAITRNDLEMVTLLIEAGAVVANEQGDHIYVAAQYGGPEIALLLLQNGSNPIGPEGFEGAVLAAATYNDNVDVVQVLLEAGAPASGNFEGLGSGWYPVLTAAAFGGSLESARILIANGADPAAVAWDGYTSAEWADAEGERELADYLRSVGG
jgi:ankyrin repeat protein